MDIFVREAPRTIIADLRLALVVPEVEADPEAVAAELRSAFDRLLVGLLRGEIAPTPLAEAVAGKKPLDPRLLEQARVLAR